MAGISSTGQILLDPSQVKDQHVSGAPNDAIQYYKVRPWLQKSTDFGTVVGGTPSASEKIVYIADGPGTINGFHAKLHAAGVSTAITVDIKKNGASIATAPISIGNSTAVTDGTLTSSSFVAGDEITLALAGTFTGAQGPCAWVNITLTNAPSN